MRRHLDLIRQRKDTVIGEYHEKLQRRANDLLSGGTLRIDAEILAREVAVFADRCDISEELTRLESHIQQFETQCRSEGSAGRRMEFISQEMLREANTIASKASDATSAMPSSRLNVPSSGSKNKFRMSSNTMIAPGRSDNAGKLVVISGPSGVGKSTICRRVIERTGAVLSVSATTRPRGRNETDGKEYSFLTRPQFEEKIAKGELLGICRGLR